MQQKKRKVFVTGGTGLLGSHLLYSLAEKGESIKANYRQLKKLDLVRKIFSYWCDNPDELFNKIEWIELDLSDAGNLKRIISGSEHVYHCAATVSYEASGKDQLIKNNTDVTVNIVKTCLETGVNKLCHVSSVATIGASHKDEITDESHQWIESDYHNAYSVSKYLSESEVWNGISKGLNAVIVNPSVILGPGYWNSGSSLFFSKISDGMLFYTNGVTGYVDVRDVVKSMIILMNGPVKGERFIISSENIPYVDFFSMIAERMNVRKPFIFIPEILSKPATGIVKIISQIRGKSGLITPDIINAAFSRVFYNNSKIKETTGVTFIPIHQSIEEITRIYRTEIPRH
ncbi:MAG: NAD-dependent epimerase/dehydratase family protein [Bacteroidales bacterium]|nr:NAD-dependent epimerase/dehydratase family protein [Bacteroidales bacterium]